MIKVNKQTLKIKKDNALWFSVYWGSEFNQNLLKTYSLILPLFWRCFSVTDNMFPLEPDNPITCSFSGNDQLEFHLAVIKKLLRLSLAFFPVVPIQKLLITLYHCLYYLTLKVSFLGWDITVLVLVILTYSRWTISANDAFLIRLARLLEATKYVQAFRYF